MDKSQRSGLIKKLALKHGFASCGISKAVKLDQEESRLSSWLNKGYQGKMTWMENHFEKRLDPSKLVPGAQSVVSLLYDYTPKAKQSDDSEYKIAKYAYGKDYHFVLKAKLKSMLQDISDEIGEVGGRVFVDSAPIMERALAAQAGLGWIGKHSLLLNRTRGSFFFIAELIIDMELEADGPATDHCGTCTACIDACPTEAIVEPYVVDSNKCISYLTIELKENIPAHFKGKMESWVFGCDICQDVCPWNKFSKVHNEPDFEPADGMIQMGKREWEELTEDVFKDLFKKSAVKRAGYLKLKKSIEFCKD